MTEIKTTIYFLGGVVVPPEAPDPVHVGNPEVARWQ